MSKVLSLSSCLAFLVSCPLLFADVPVRINFVGQLDAVPNGETVGSPTGEKAMFVVFRLYDEPGHGRDADKDAALWGRQTTVALENGVFDVDLSDALGSKVAGPKYDSLADAIDAALARGSSTLYIGLTPENDTQAEIFPRMRVSAVPKAVQASVVRTLPDDFTVGNGVFDARGLVVEGDASLAQASYGAVAFTNKGQIAFAGGLAADTVTALSAEVAGDVHANNVAVGALEPKVSVSVNGPVTLRGAATLDGDLGASSGPTVGVSVVSGKVSGAVGEAARLVVGGDFKNEAGKGFDAIQSSDWNILGDWVTTAADDFQSGSTYYQILCWDEDKGCYYSRQSVTVGLWSAPCDCIAYFQTHIRNLSTSRGAAVQFYLVESANDESFASRTPQAVASLRNGKSGNGPTLDTAVPMILKKGQCVKWIGTNGNQNMTTEIPETEDSCVQTITYRKFNW